MGDVFAVVFAFGTVPTWKVILIAAAAYLIGNLSPSIMLGKLHGVDIKKEGSGNAGTTNVLRVLGKKAAVITLVIDVLKGAVAVLLGTYLVHPNAGYICALAVFCGHIWPCLYGFRGGKGVATAFGALLAVNWMLGLGCLVIVALGVIITQRMSVGSLAGAVTFPVVCYFTEPDFVIVGSVMALIIILKHRANIQRLFKGKEPKMSFKSKK